MGRYQKKLYTMLNTTYPNFVSDFNKEYSKQKIALQLVELRLETGLSQSRYAEENQLLQNKISAIEKGKRIHAYQLLSKWPRRMDIRLN